MKCSRCYRRMVSKQPLCHVCRTNTKIKSIRNHGRYIGEIVGEILSRELSVGNKT